MFDEIDVNALGITILVSLLFGWIFFFDPVGVGMSDLAFSYRLIGWIGGTIVGYVVAARMMEE